MSDIEQCLNGLQLDLILLLVNLSSEYGRIMTRYDFIEARRVILRLHRGQTSDFEQCSNRL